MLKPSGKNNRGLSRENEILLIQILCVYSKVKISFEPLTKKINKMPATKLQKNQFLYTIGKLRFQVMKVDFNKYDISLL